MWPSLYYHKSSSMSSLADEHRICFIVGFSIRSAVVVPLSAAAASHAWAITVRDALSGKRERDIVYNCAFMITI